MEKESGRKIEHKDIDRRRLRKTEKDGGAKERRKPTKRRGKK